MISMEIKGVQQAARNLKKIDEKMRKRVTRKATTAAGSEQVKETKQQAKRFTKTKGAGKIHPRSIGKRIKQYQSGSVYYAVVGTKAGYSQQAVYTTVFTPKTGNDRREKVIVSKRRTQPELIDHFLNFGFRVVVGGTLSRDQSKAGFNKKGERRRTTRLSAGGRRYARYLRHEKGLRKKAASREAFQQDKRAGKGRIVGGVDAEPYLEDAAVRSRAKAINAFAGKIKSGVQEVLRGLKK